MKIVLAKTLGYCFGVKKAIETAYARAGSDVCILGDIIHNRAVVDDLARHGVKTVYNIDSINAPAVIIRSHGVGEDIYKTLRARNLEIIDCTCPFVAKIHGIVRDFANRGFSIVIAGHPSHAEVVGTDGWCAGTATVVENAAECEKLRGLQKICLVAQTTFDAEEYRKIIQLVSKLECKTLEIFDTICYTTIDRQQEAAELAKSCTKLLVLGSTESSNTDKLYRIGKAFNKDSFLIENIGQLKSIGFLDTDRVGITSGASTHQELIQEVLQHMADNAEAQNDFGQMLDDEQYVNYKKGAIVKEAEIISVGPEGITAKIGGKNDGFVPAAEAQFEGEYSTANFAVGTKIDVIITGTKNPDTGLIPLSKKQYDAVRIGNKIVDTIRNNEEFELKVTKVVDKGLIGYLGNYRVFVPQSHVAEHFVKNLEQFAGTTLRLRALEIDDEKQKIVASQKIVLSEERAGREKDFFDHVYPDAVVIGKVMRTTPFGAFVNVGGFDCLAHITDLSWTKISKVEDVLTIGEEYEFLVLKIDKEKSRVSLGYKQLHLHPFHEIAEKYNIGDTITGKVVRLAPFGAFVEIEKGVDGLVHISEASHEFVKDINEVLKVGDEVRAVITKIDDENRKISLSVKAASPAPAHAEGEEHKRFSGDGAKHERKPRRDDRSVGGEHQWNESSSNNVFADLLKDIKDKE